MPISEVFTDNLTRQAKPEDVVRALASSPWDAHWSLFSHRHHDATPHFHEEIISLWHSAIPRLMLMAFRGAGKSTLSEEAIIVGACYKRFHNGIILGSSYERACERLAAIKYEFETNQFIEPLFGNMVGRTWNEGKVILSNGVVLQAFGRGQSLRGSKHLDRRPDICFADDVEEQEDVDTPEARAKMLKWFMKVVVPALDPHSRIRMAATPLHPESLAMLLSKERGWETRVYPIETIGPAGERIASWPARFPIDAVDARMAEFHSLGLMTEYKQEYMCEAENEADKAFTKDMFRIEPIARTWHAVYGFYDPARSVRSTSATTGWCYFSWINNRLIVWDAGASFWKPDELIDHIFKMDAEYSPVEIGIERDGLEEWVLQPLRHEMLKRQQFIPIAPYKAPIGKIQFIKQLQVFFKAREVIFAKQLPELEKQLINFPQGLIDAPNALAYATRMRPGVSIYQDFSVTNIYDDLSISSRVPLWCCVNASANWTTAVLVQSVEGGIHVLADAVADSNPGQVLSEIMAAIGVEAGRSYRSIAPPGHFTGHDTVGLRPAANRVPVSLSRGGASLAGQAEIGKLLKLFRRGEASFKVSQHAKWTLNALSGGYCKDILKNGQPSEFVKPGPYKVLMEGLESFAALLRVGMEQDDMERRYAYDDTGRRYLTARSGVPSG